MLPRSLAASSHPINGSKASLDSRVGITVPRTEKVSTPFLSSPLVAASNGLVVTDSRRSNVRDAKTRFDCPCWNLSAEPQTTTARDLLLGAGHAVLGTLCSRA